MANTARQTAIFGVEDWKRLYQTFREADFQSYDFETLRKSFVDYLRLYYPETFNDYVESSEFIALLDLMAFMGQALAFRNDLNSRENFLDSAERRDSVVRLANLVGYTPKRNTAAQGFLKVFSVSTSENMVDFNGYNLQNVVVDWNDATNPNWLEQFAYVINAALVDSQKFGRPGNSQTLLGVRTDEYTINLINGVLPVVSYTSVVDNVSMPFEAVSATSLGRDYVYEQPPLANNKFNILYRNDQLGYGSENTGFFLLFKQGALQNVDFNLAESISNRTVDINIEGCNEHDHWLFQIDSNGTATEEWNYTENIYAVESQTSAANKRTSYSVASRANDQITLVFGDGVFSKIPVGSFRTYVRASNGLEYVINPEEMQGVTLSIPYVSRAGRTEYLTLVCGISESVSNAQSRESIEDIKQRAPARYYTQNRMVNGEDYNNFPFTKFNSILKSKAVARSAIGSSRYADLTDVTGKYSSTNIYSSDGAIYQVENIGDQTFSWFTRNDIADIINNKVEPLITTRGMMQFYYDPNNFARPQLTELGIAWHKSTAHPNETTGYFYRISNNTPVPIGSYTNSNARYITQSSLVRFVPPAGYCFDANNRLKAGAATKPGEKLQIWASVIFVVDEGTAQGLGNLPDGIGPVVINNYVPTGAIPAEVIPKFVTDFSAELEQQIIQQIELYRDFGIGYNHLSASWYLITSTNLAKYTPPNTVPFDYNSHAQNLSNPSTLDASWLLQFVTDGQNYSINARSLDYVFASVIETRFTFDNNQRIYDTKTGAVIKDFIRVLRTNSQPHNSLPMATDVVMDIISQPIQSDGYVNDYEVYVSYQDSDEDGIADDPDFFDNLVKPADGLSLVFLQQTIDFDNLERWLPVADNVINTTFGTLAEINLSKDEYTNGQLFYAIAEQQFYELHVTLTNGMLLRTLTQRTDFKAYVGRSSLAFQYRHNSSLTNVIDPGVSNIVDMYVVVQNYYRAYQNYIRDTTDTVPMPDTPTIAELNTAYSTLNNYKMLSDNIVLNSVTFKPLFGAKAAPELQATIKVVRLAKSVASISEIKSQIISHVNDYFSIDKWDFGDSFFFSELSAYLHKQMGSVISSVVLVPRSPEKTFGDLYEIRCAPNEIFVSAATVNDVEVIDALTQSNIRSQTNVSGLY